MAQTPDETRREIEETRLRIARAAEELEERFQRTTDWHRWVDQYPLESVLIALGAGLLTSSIVVPGIIGAVASIGRRQVRERPAGGGGGALNLLRPIIVPVVTARIIDFMRREIA